MEEHAITLDKIGCADVEEYDRLIQPHRRDLNCLSDPSRFKRKSAYKRIHDFVNQEVSAKRDKNRSKLLLGMLLNDFLPAACSGLADELERCRVLATDICCLVLAEVKAQCEQKLDRDAAEYVATTTFVKVSAAARKQLEADEPSEELRLVLAGLLHSVLDWGVHGVNSEQLASMLACVPAITRACADAFPDVKVVAADSTCLLTQIIQTHSASLESVSDTLESLKPLIPALAGNLRHQQSKVRKAAVKGLTYLSSLPHKLDCRNEFESWLESVVDSLSHISFDRSASVRTALITHLQALVSRTFQENLTTLLGPALLLMVGGLGDEAEAVQKHTLQALQDVATDCLGEQKEANDNLSNFLSQIVPYLLPLALKEAVHWTPQNRRRALGILKAFVEHGSITHTADVHRLLNTFTKALKDDEREVVMMTRECLLIVGNTLLPTCLPYFWPRLDGQVHEDMPAQPAEDCLAVLKALVAGASDDLKSQVADIMAALHCSHVSRNDSVLARFTCIEILLALVEKCPELFVHPKEKSLTNVATKCFETAQTVIGVSQQHATEDDQKLVRIDSSDETVTTQARLVLSKLAERAEISLDELYYEHLCMIQPYFDAASDQKSLSSQSRDDQFIFVTFVDGLGSQVQHCLNDVVRVFRASYTEDTSPFLRMSLLQLLMKVISTLSSSDDQLLSDILSDLIIPACTWRAGKVEAVIRTQGIQCLYSLLSLSFVGASVLDQAQAELLSTVQANMDDDAEATRRLILDCLSKLFAKTDSVSPETLKSLYPDVLKRMDDSSDSVRIAAAKTILLIVRLFGDAQDTVGILSIAKACIIYLDDESEALQDVVVQILLACATSDRTAVRELVQKEASNFINQHHCERVLKQTSAAN